MGKKYITLVDNRAALAAQGGGLPLAETSPGAAVGRPVVTIDGLAAAAPPGVGFDPAWEGRKLSDAIRRGRSYHEAADPGNFVQRVQLGFYAYERRIVWKTCLLAAAYAGEFGPQAVERLTFSYSMAVYRLSSLYGYDLKTVVVDPLGIRGPLAERIIKLYDDHYWDHHGVCEWLASGGL